MKIAIVNVGMHGHVNPTLGFTEALVRRGHKVHYFGTEDFRTAIESTGATLHTYGSELGQHAAAFANIPKEERTNSQQFPNLLLQDFEKTAPILVPALEKLRPDVILYDFISSVASKAATELNIPGIKLFTSYAMNEKFNPFAKMMAEMNLNDTFKTMMGYIEKTNLVFLPKEFQIQPEAFEDSYHFVGPCLRKHSEADLADFKIASFRPLLVISLGTLFNAWPEFYQNCFEAFKETPWQVVMSVGSQIQIDSLGKIPDNFIVKNHIPQLSLLEKATAFISHGGMNSTQEALYFGVPLVSIPQMEEQEITARRLQELRLGQFLAREEVSVESLREAVIFVSENLEVQKNIALMQQAVRDAGGTARVVKMVESFSVAPSHLAESSL